MQRIDGHLPIAALAALVACGVGDERARRVNEAIAGGDADATDTAVVALLRCNGACDLAAPSASLICSGTLVAPTLVLTARHCVAPVLDDASGVACSRTKFGAALDARALAVTTSAGIGGARWSGAARVHVPDGDAFCGGDLALVELAAPAPAPPFAPRLDLAPAVGERYAAIGFGATTPGGGVGERSRRDGLALGCLDVSCAPRGPDGLGAIVAGEMIGAAGGCPGDSGGPALDEAERVLGVLSRGDAACGTPVYERLDARAAWIAAVAVQAAAAGGYVAPAWASVELADAAAPAEAAAAAPLSPRGGCAVAPRARGAFGAHALVVAALALRGRARRRGRKC